MEPSVKEAAQIVGSYSVPTEPLSSLSGRGDARVVALDAGATANLAFAKWLRHHKAILERLGIPIAKPYSA